MRMYSFLYRLIGYYRAEYSSPACETILNETLKYNIPVWRIRRLDAGTVSFCIRRTDRQRIETIAGKLHGRGAGLSLTLCGFPTLFKKYSGRWGLITGAVFTAVLVAVFSNFIWSVKIDGNAKFSREYIKERLADIGISEGKYLGNMDMGDLKLKFLIKNPEISYVALNVKGTVVYVQVREREPQLESEDTSGVYNLVADSDGQIVRYAVYEGNSVVEVGETVLKGQLLVSGLNENKLGVFSAVHAAGKVFARTSHDFEATVPLERVDRVFTGREISRKTLNILGKRINLFINSRIPYDFYDTIKVNEDATVFDRAELPFTVDKTTFMEYREKPVKISVKKATDLCYDEYHSWLAYELPDSEIESSDVKITENGDSVTLKARVNCIENIAVAKKVDVCDFTGEDDSEKKEQDF